MPCVLLTEFDVFLWIKALHVIAVISWMAGLLYLPRLMVYHSGVDVGTERDETFKIMERRLLNAIMTPAGLVTVVSGGYLIGSGGFLPLDLWLQLKLLCVVCLFVCHGVLWRHVSAFARGQRLRTARFYRVVNEVPTLLMVVIVVCVVVKPFD